MGEALAIILGFILMGLGLAGAILPFLPGVPIAWLGLFVYALVTGFSKISLTIVLVFLGLTILAMLIDFVLPLWGAKRYRASRYGIVGALIGLVVGFFVGPFGIILLPLAGAFLGEIIKSREADQAIKSVLGVLVGTLANILIKIIIILIMLGFFIAALFK